MFEKIIDTAEKGDIFTMRYINFAFGGEKEAVHNTKYWENKEYLGIGFRLYSGYLDNIRYKKSDEIFRILWW